MLYSPRSLELYSALGNRVLVKSNRNKHIYFDIEMDFCAEVLELRLE